MGRNAGAGVKCLRAFLWNAVLENIVVTASKMGQVMLLRISNRVIIDTKNIECALFCHIHSPKEQFWILLALEEDAGMRNAYRMGYRPSEVLKTKMRWAFVLQFHNKRRTGEFRDLLFSTFGIVTHEVSSLVFCASLPSYLNWMIVDYIREMVDRAKKESAKDMDCIRPSDDTVEVEPCSLIVQQRFNEEAVVGFGNHQIHIPVASALNIISSRSALMSDTILDLLLARLRFQYSSLSEANSISVLDSSEFGRIFRAANVIKENAKFDLKFKASLILETIYPLRKGTRIIPVFDKDLVVFPVVHKGHWCLIIIQGMRNCIRSLIEISIENEDIRHHVDPQPAKKCRIIIMDALMHHPKYKESLSKLHMKIFYLMKTWVLVMIHEILGEYPGSFFSLIVCKNMPRQENTFDCGFFTYSYIEEFVFKNRGWISMKDSEVENMGSTISREQFAHKVGELRHELQQVFGNLLLNPSSSSSLSCPG